MESFFYYAVRYLSSAFRREMETIWFHFDEKSSATFGKITLTLVAFLSRHDVNIFHNSFVTRNKTFQYPNHLHVKVLF